MGVGETDPKSLTKQRGDGIKARHIPELLKYISDNDTYEYHIWGFEEPENSLDFVAAQSEAKRILTLANDNRIQIFMTTHSPSFYMLQDESISRFLVSKDENKLSTVLQGKELDKMDPQQAMAEGFYLPVVADALRGIALTEQRARDAEERALILGQELKAITTPVILTEGRTDAKILHTAWTKLFPDEAMPFKIKSCETGIDVAGTGNGGAQSLGVCIKGVAADHPHIVVGLFDYDEAGIQEFKLDRNFSDFEVSGNVVRRGVSGRVYAVLLPAPECRAECHKYKNMPIEYLFNDDFLETASNGKSIELKLKQTSAKLGDHIIRKDLENHTHFKTISGNKVYFSEHVVSKLPVEAFDGFRPLFSLLLELVDIAIPD